MREEASGEKKREQAAAAQSPAESMAGLTVCVSDARYGKQGEALARHLGAVYRGTVPESDPQLMLRFDERGLALREGSLEVRGDFMGMERRIRQPNLNSELLVKAARIREPGGAVPTAVDATAGLGEDAFLLAAAGFAVDMYEHDPVIAALLRDGLERAGENPVLRDAAGRLTLHEEDSLGALGRLGHVPDVIYLDPMFPERRKSGLVKKKFQLLHRLEHPCMNEEELLLAAVAAHPHKVVIKRPLKGPYLAGRKPSFSIEGKAIRYDCLVL